MIVFFKNLPEKTTYDDLVHFVEPALKGNFFKKKGEIERVQMLIIKDPKKENLEFHGLVRIEPDIVAERVIKKLNRKIFLGYPIEVREYFLRSGYNDRREYNLPPNHVLLGQRKNDRRRTYLEKIIVEANAEGQFKYIFL